ncbi:MAG TPA: hypothetical protein VEW45_01605 [Candidatus Dormibacteraeota bacterium]|nr:hypothetical protein [Candidatus Dormibacteraeota bacterium]
MSKERDTERTAPYIGQRPDDITDQIEERLDPDTERVAVTDNESSGEGAADRRVQGRDDEWPHGHRHGDRASDHDVRKAGESG